jgi:hypothetical protein
MLHPLFQSNSQSIIKSDPNLRPPTFLANIQFSIGIYEYNVCKDAFATSVFSGVVLLIGLGLKLLSSQASMYAGFRSAGRRMIRWLVAPIYSPALSESLTPLAAVCILSLAVFSRRPCGKSQITKFAKQSKSLLRDI